MMIRSATGGLGLGRLGRCRATHLLSIRRSIGGSARVRIEQQQQQQLKSAASQPAPWSRLLVRSALLGGTAGGVYRVTRPINEDGTDPAYIARMPGWQQLPMRAYHRLMSVYKGIADPDVHDLLPDPFPVDSPYYRPKTLVVELDNVLVHSEYDRDQGWSVAKRPWADYFLAHMCRYYEIVVFTRQTPTYAQPIIAKLDNQMGTVLYQLYDDSTVYDIESGEQLKDLSMLNRDPKNVIMLDLKRFPTLQPDNLVEVPEWTGKEPSDTWLLDVIPFLELLAYSEDVRQVLPNYHGKDIPTAVLQSVREQEQKAAAEAERVAEERRKAAKKLASGGGWIGKVMSWIGDAVGVSPASVAAVRPAQPALTSEALISQTAMEVAHFQQELEQQKKLQEEERKQREEEHKRIMDKASGIRVTLWEIMTQGVDAAILAKADPEVRAFIETNMAMQQPPPSTEASVPSQ